MAKLPAYWLEQRLVCCCFKTTWGDNENGVAQILSAKTILVKKVIAPHPDFTGIK